MLTQYLSPLLQLYLGPPLRLNMMHPSMQDIHCRFTIVIWNHTNRRFPHFPFYCCIEFIDFFPWPSDSIPTTAPIYSIIVAPSHCYKPILDEIFLSDFSTVNSWTMDESVIISFSSILCSYLFFPYQTFL